MNYFKRLISEIIRDGTLIGPFWGFVITFALMLLAKRNGAFEPLNVAFYVAFVCGFLGMEHRDELQKLKRENEELKRKTINHHFFEDE
jgi:hypothetical protein